MSLRLHTATRSFNTTKSVKKLIVGRITHNERSPRVRVSFKDIETRKLANLRLCTRKDLMPDMLRSDSGLARISTGLIAGTCGIRKRKEEEDKLKVISDLHFTLAKEKQRLKFTVRR